MGGLYQWVSGILCFMIFVSAVRAVLPSKKYEKYIRFFTGVVLILLVVQPVLEIFGLEDRLVYYFEQITFQRETEDLKREILGLERQRLERVIGEYEGAVEQDVRIMAEEMGFGVDQVEVAIERDQEKENYGTVTHVYMVVRKGWERADKGAEETWEPIQIGTIEIGPVETRAADEDAGYAGTENITTQDAQKKDVQDTEKKPAEGDAKGELAQDLGELRRKVEGYYGLEGQEVEIKYKGGQG